ncbi:hypothetical protein ADL05_04675, partial [Nocardiopsis sp. NRRL B-16309]
TYSVCETACPAISSHRARTAARAIAWIGWRTGVSGGAGRARSRGAALSAPGGPPGPARRRGLRVPEDFSVGGYDAPHLIASPAPPLTTVRQPIQAMALAAVRALCDEIAGHAVSHT